MLLFILLLVGVLIVYFIPTIVGWNKRDADAIIALNFFLGWTFIGWVVALVWALTKDHEPTKIIQNIYVKEFKNNEQELEDDSFQVLEQEKLTKEWIYQAEIKNQEETAWNWFINKFKRTR
jgi:hypothetical protein